MGQRMRTRLAPLEAILALRNHTAHGAIPDEFEAARHLETYLPVLHQVLDAFDFLGDTRMKVRFDGPIAPAANHVWVHEFAGARSADPREEALTEALAAAFQESETVLVVADGRIVPLYPMANPLRRASRCTFTTATSAESSRPSRRSSRVSSPTWGFTTRPRTARRAPGSNGCWPIGRSASCWTRVRLPPGRSPTTRPTTHGGRSPTCWASSISPSATSPLRRLSGTLADFLRPRPTPRAGPETPRCRGTLAALSSRAPRRGKDGAPYTAG